MVVRKITQPTMEDVTDEYPNPRHGGRESMKKVKLIPPDRKRCQAEKPNGANAFTLGGRPGFVRCDATPTYIATEIKKPKGSMSVCDWCAGVLNQQMPGHATLMPIVRRKK